MAHDVFVSYSAEDKPIADAVCAALEAERIRCWIAPRDVLPGRDYAEMLIEAIREAGLMILVFSSSSNRSPHVMREVERAASRGIPILPFRIEDVPPCASMKYYISSTHWLDALTPPLERHLKHLAETVQLLLERSGRGAPVTAEPGARVPAPVAEVPTATAPTAGTPAVGAPIEAATVAPSTKLAAEANAKAKAAAKEKASPPEAAVESAKPWYRRLVLLGLGAAAMAVVAAIVVVAVLYGGGEDGTVDGGTSVASTVAPTTTATASSTTTAAATTAAAPAVSWKVEQGTATSTRCASGRYGSVTVQTEAGGPRGGVRS